MEKVRILIGITTEANVCTETMESIYNLSIPVGVDTDLCIIHSYNVADGRNDLVNMMYNGNYDYIFFVDSDVVLPKNALVDLYEMNWYFTTGTYPRKEKDTLTKADPFTTLYWHNDSNKDHYCPYFMPFSALQEGYIIQVDCCGFGCTLVKKDLFDQLERPFFFMAHEECAKDGENNDLPYCMGEDMYFCRQVVQKGYQIWAHGSVQCGHVGRYVYRFPTKEEQEQRNKQ